MSIQTCPTAIVHAPSEQVWWLLTAPADLQRWIGARIVWFQLAHHNRSGPSDPLSGARRANRATAIARGAAVAKKRRAPLADAVE